MIPDFLCIEYKVGKWDLSVCHFSVALGDSD